MKEINLFNKDKAQVDCKQKHERHEQFFQQ